MSKVSGGDSKSTLYCSFCGKSQHEVRKLIAGPTVFICDECVELCMDIIREESKSSLVKSRDGVPTPTEINKVLAGMTALGRVGLPDDIGPMIANLLSDDNRWINAQRIEVSGGQAI